MPRKASKSTPVVLSGTLYTDDDFNGIRLMEWTLWKSFLDTGRTFYYDGLFASFTARCEIKQGAQYWYAFKKRDGKLTKHYIGMPVQMTANHLEKISRMFG